MPLDWCFQPGVKLDFRRFEEHNSVDRQRFPSFTNELRQSMFEEPMRYFVDVAGREGFPDGWMPLFPAPNEQARARVARRAIRMERADDVLEFLVRNHPADEQNVGPLVVELLRDEALRRLDVGPFQRRRRRGKRFSWGSGRLWAHEKSGASSDHCDNDNQ